MAKFIKHTLKSTELYRHYGELSLKTIEQGCISQNISSAKEFDAFEI